MPTPLEADEREISITQTDTDRAEGFWTVYSSSPYWTRKLDKIAEAVSADAFGGKQYRLHQRQILLRKVPAPVQLSDEERARRAERMRKTLHS